MSKDYIRKQKDYIEKQEGWVRSNNITVGSEVIIGKYDENARGWSAKWLPQMHDSFNKKGTVKSVLTHSGIRVCINGNTLSYPYFILEVAKEPKENWYLLD